MHAVAFRPPSGAVAELAAGLARALGLTRLEAAARLQAAANGPAIARAFADAAAAERCAATLVAAGCRAWVLSTDARPTSRLEVHRFTLGSAELAVRERGGREASLPWDRVRLLLHGRRLRTETQVQTVRHQKLSIPRALLTGGLVMSKTVVERKHVSRGESEGFVLVEGGPLTFSFRQLELDYRGLEARLQPSQLENFALLVAALRERAPEAVVDESLLDRAMVAQRLGPGLNPETHLDLAIALARDVRLGDSG